MSSSERKQQVILGLAIFHTLDAIGYFIKGPRKSLT